MDCRSMHALMPFARRSGELPADEAARVRRHLDQCPLCRAAVEADDAFDAAIGRAMHQVEVPPWLRERVGVGLAQQRGRTIQRRIAQVAAVAICLILLLSVTVVRWTSRIAIHSDQLVQDEDQHFVLEFNRNIESAREYFRSQGLKTQLPDDLDYSLMTQLEVVSFRGRRAARIDFQLGEKRMKVFVLPRREFRVSRQASDDAVGSHATIEVVEASDNYLFVFVCFNEADRQMFQPRAVIG